MTKHFASLLTIAATLLLASIPASATVTAYTDRTMFSSQGSITYNYGFDDLDTSLANTGGSGELGLPNSWTTQGITYNALAGNNEIVGTSIGLGLTSNALISNSFNGGLITGAISGSFDMFGFDFGTLLGSSSVNISLMTNLGGYSFSNLAAPLAPATTFFGFKAGATEYFTSFSVTNTADGSIPALDNITLGLATISPIPEPESIVLLASGLLLLGGLSRMRRI